MIAILSLIPITGFIFTFKHVKELKGGSGIILTVSAIIVISFFFGVIGIIRYSTNILWLLGTIILCFLIWKDRYVLYKYFDPPFILWIILALVFWLVHSNSRFTFYDEFSHWGIFTKELYFNHEFWTDDSHIRHPRYVPGQALWIYFVISHCPYSEGAAYLAQFLLLSAPLMLFFENLHWRQWPWILALLACLGFGLANWGHGIADLHVDHLISVWFLGVLLYGMYLVKENRFSVSLVFPLSVLALIKDVGLFFAVSGACLIFLIQITQPRRSFRFIKINICRKSFFYLIVSLIIPITCVTIWKVERLTHCTRKSTGIEDVLERIFFNNENNDQAVKDLISFRFWDVFLTQHISKGEPSRNFNVFNYYNKDIYTSKFRLLPFQISTAIFIIFYIAISFCIIIWSQRFRNDCKTWLAFYLYLLIMTICYVFILYMHYITLLPGTIAAQTANNDGTHVCSYMRFMHSMLLPLGISLILPFIPQFSCGCKDINKCTFSFRYQLKSAKNLFILSFMILLLYILDPPYLKPYYQSKKVNPFAYKVESVAQMLVRTLPRNSSIWIYLPNNQSMFSWILKYHLVPLIPHVNTDQHFFERPVEGITNEWIRYDFIWIPNRENSAISWIASFSGESVKRSNIFGAQALVIKILRNIDKKEHNKSVLDCEFIKDHCIRIGGI